MHALWPGDWFGEAGLLVGRRQVTVTAASPSTALYLPRAAIEAMVQQHPQHWALFSWTALQHLREALTALSDALLPADAQRVAAVLLRLSGCRAATPQPFAALAVPATQGEIAVMAKVSRGTAHKVLQGWRDDGLIAAGYGTVRVLQPDALRALLAGPATA